MSILRFKLLLIWLFSLSAVIATVQVLSLLADNPYHSKQRDFELQANRIEAIVLGTSHSKAIHFPSLKIPGFSYHDSGSDVQSASDKYQAIAPLMPNLKYVLLPISPAFLHLVWSDEINTNREKSIYANYPKYSNFHGSLYWTLLLNKSEYTLQKLRLYFRKKLKALLPHSQSSYDPLSCMPIWSGNKSHEDGFINGYADAYADPQCIEKLAEITVKSHAKHSINRKDTQSNFKQNTKEITAMIEVLASHQHQLILFIPPFTAEYYDHKIWATVKAENRRYLEKISQEPNVTFIDYHDLFYKRNYLETNTLFYDDDHLGLKGAKEFSKILGRDIRQLESQ